MTSLLSRYVIWFLAKIILATNCAVMSLFFVLTLLDNLSRSSISGLFHGLLDTLLRMAEILYLTMPASCAIGAAIGLAILDSRREIAIMRLSGVNFARLTRWVGAAALVWVVIHLIVGEMLLPRSASAALKLQAQQEGSLITARDEVWLRIPDGFASIAFISPDGKQLADVQLFVDREQYLDTVTLAEKAQYVDGNWQLENVVTAKLIDQYWNFTEQDRQVWTDGPTPEFLTSFRLKPSKLSVFQLLALSAELQKFAQNTLAIDLVIWSRFADTAMIILLMLSSLSQIRNRTRYSSTHARTAGIVALAVMLVYYYMSVIIRQVSLLENLPALFGAFLPPLLFTLLLLMWIGYLRYRR